MSICYGQFEIHPGLKVKAYLADNKVDSAIFLLNQLIEAKQNSEKWLMYRGEYFLKIGLYNEAIKDFVQVEKKRPSMASFQLAKAYAMLRDSINTMFYLEKNLKSSYKVNKNKIWKDKSFDYIKNTYSWKKLWEKEWYTRFEYYEGEMRYLYESGNWTEVINMMADIGKDSKKLSAQAFYMVAMSYMQLENYSAAITNFSKAILKSKKEASYYASRGDCYMRMKNYSKALDDFSTAINYGPEELSYYLQHTQALLNLGKYDLAYHEVLTLTQLFPENIQSLYILSQAAYLSKRYLHALEVGNKLLNQSPEDTSYLHLRAKTYKKTGMFSQSLKDYNLLLKNHPLQTEYLVERGLLYFQLNEKRQACLDWKKSSELGNVRASQLLWENCTK
ncbi:MAG: tetratricopeptide repeat protein [Bacteroidales bacterium]|nr:tetratricopeptide repeat protein [Bacteroidales bacterium]